MMYDAYGDSVTQYHLVNTPCLPVVPPYADSDKISSYKNVRGLSAPP